MIKKESTCELLQQKGDSSVEWRLTDINDGNLDSIENITRDGNTKMLAIIQSRDGKKY